MENLDLKVLRTLLQWRQAGRHALLATVVRTWGSSPRPIGSIMALCDDGQVVGSVSGGCIEDDLIYRYSQLYQAGEMPQGAPEIVRYGIKADEAHRFGLPCGGTLELVLEFDPEVKQLAQLVTALQGGKLIQRKLDLASGQVALLETDTPSQLEIDQTQVCNTFGPEYRLLLIGAGQLAEYLATMALFNGFAVTVCDPREEYSRGWSVAGVSLTTDMPDDVVRQFNANQRSGIITLTHDPKLDDLALIEALETPAFYIGAIGSRSNNALRRQRLIEYFDQTPQSLKRLRGPVGLFIGSKTPSEIAVSIMAELLAVKNGVTLSPEMDVETAKNTLGIPHAETA